MWITVLYKYIYISFHVRKMIGQLYISWLADILTYLYINFFLSKLIGQNESCNMIGYLRTTLIGQIPWEQDCWPNLNIYFQSVN